MSARTYGVIAIALAALASPLEAQELSGGERALQVAGGIAGAWVLGMGAWSAIDDPESPDRKVKGDSGYQPNANTAYAIGSWIGSTLGVYAVGKAFCGDCGSLGKTALGTGLVSVVLVFRRDDPWLPLVGMTIGAPLQAIAGMIGFGH
jgi:hypothetical protein